VIGFSEKDEVIFSFSDSKQKLSQKFGVSLKYYKAHQVHNANDRFEFMWGLPEGAYLFAPE
jgi:hypothetical protein